MPPKPQNQLSEFANRSRPEVAKAVNIILAELRQNVDMQHEFNAALEALTPVEQQTLRGMYTQKSDFMR